MTETIGGKRYRRNVMKRLLLILVGIAALGALGWKEFPSLQRELKIRGM